AIPAKHFAVNEHDFLTGQLFCYFRDMLFFERKWFGRKKYIIGLLSSHFMDSKGRIAMFFFINIFKTSCFKHGADESIATNRHIRVAPYQVDYFWLRVYGFKLGKFGCYRRN